MAAQTEVHRQLVTSLRHGEDDQPEEDGDGGAHFEERPENDGGGLCIKEL